MKTTTKLTLTALTALTLAANAYAAGITASELEQEKVLFEQEKVLFCESIAKASGAAMRFRQANKPLAELLRIANGNPVLMQISAAAYESPAYSTAKMQEREIAEFSNTHMLECMKNPRQYFLPHAN